MKGKHTRRVSLARGRVEGRVSSPQPAAEKTRGRVKGHVQIPQLAVEETPGRGEGRAQSPQLAAEKLSHLNKKYRKSVWPRCVEFERSTVE